MLGKYLIGCNVETYIDTIDSIRRENDKPKLEYFKRSINESLITMLLESKSSYCESLIGNIRKMWELDLIDQKQYERFIAVAH